MQKEYFLPSDFLPAVRNNQYECPVARCLSRAIQQRIWVNYYNAGSVVSSGPRSTLHFTWWKLGEQLLACIAGWDYGRAWPQEVVGISITNDFVEAIEE